LSKKIALLTGTFHPDDQRRPEPDEILNNLFEKPNKNSIPSEVVVEDTRFNFDFEQYHKDESVHNTEVQEQR
jgi:hypothetical protein